MNNAVKYRVIQITIANLAKNIDKVVTFLLKMYVLCFDKRTNIC